MHSSAAIERVQSKIAPRLEEVTEVRLGARCIVTSIGVAAWLSVIPSLAGRPTMEECFEGSDFIGNAARSRDAGVAADRFLGRMEDDFVAIRAFPNELRWFVHDADDEAFLLDSAREVFEHPGAPDRHRAAFLRACIDRMAMGGEQAPEPAPPRSSR